MTAKAYSFVREVEAGPARELRTDRHYLLYASAGALRLAAEGQVWLLPPARAALVEAGRPIQVSIPRPVRTASVLFDTGFAPPPPAPLAVFDLSPLARCLVAECGGWGDPEQVLPPYAETMFAALAAVTWRLAEQPSPVTIPEGRSPELRLALRLTEARLGEEVRFKEVAARVGLTPRSLARRFAGETGMTWRAVLRRMRLARAIEELVAGDAPVTAVAFQVGYSSLSAFNAAFLELTGRTPTEYRVSCQG
ncbi:MULTISPECIES: AraC family transcriptional regulator [unclassified Crossiella]|uniref:AraC family transcriptional regulator n=1 Tax=unclassified Crossiella TaxID=2620835 RepID=UPI001FFE31D0|nr:MULTISPECIES: AraC family transcriptional regulator [unclassified Crossiella]MCK2238030.1 AraC family transcriptional regulator [Crossiella sp. S99.2]MCK2255313.1 AraC family transcriptional regulator [Crossiella sp. S99.1]